MDPVSHSTYQLSGIVLKLRDDLGLSPRATGGAQTWIIEDERTSRFYRVGSAEYAFLSQLDGRRTFGEALGRSAALLRDAALTEEAAAAFCRWLVESGLATTEHSRTTARVLKAQHTTQRRRRLAGLANPLSQRIPLLHPDRLFRTLNAACGWLLSEPMLWLWMSLVACGGWTLAVHWDKFRSAVPQVIDRHNWLWLALTTLVLKLLHETAHGLACRRCGGPVREAGIVLVLFVPLPYVDVTSAWRFGSRRHRIATSAAGIAAELLLAAVAVFAWAHTDSPLWKQHAANVILAASLMTVLVNANPLMRFDGYFILSDWLELPNLALHGQQAWQSLGRRWFLGLPGIPQSWPRRHTGLILIYGLAALAWRIAVCIGLVLAADALFFGAGVVLAALAVVGWVMVPLLRLMWFVAVGAPHERPSRLQFTAATLGVATLALCASRRLYWHPRIDAPAVVVFDSPSEVRAPVAGFIRDVLTTDSAVVTDRQPLLRLENPELDSELTALRIQIEQAQVRADRRLYEGSPAAWEVEQEQLVALRSRRTQLESQARSLVIAAPRSGRILDSDVANLVGRYVRPGDLLLSLGADDDKRAVALIDPRDRDNFGRLSGARLTFQIDGRFHDDLNGRLLDLSPRAVRELPHPALGADAQGPLSVRPIAAADPSQRGSYELLTPRFAARLELDSTDRLRLQPGETGRVRITGEARTLGACCVTWVANWWETRQAALLEQWYVR